MAVEKAAVRAVQKGEPEAAAAAVKAAGGWTTALTRNGDTALHLAAAFDRPQVLRLALGTQITPAERRGEREKNTALGEGFSLPRGTGPLASLFTITCMVLAR